MTELKMGLDRDMQSKNERTSVQWEATRRRLSFIRHRLNALLRTMCLFLLPICIVGCASSQLTQSGNLKSYSHLKPSDGILTKTRQWIDRKAVRAARTVQIEPTRVTRAVYKSGLTGEQLGLVANALDRRLCSGLSKRFKIVGPKQSADLRVAAIITDLKATDVLSATASKAVNVGGTMARLATGVPVPVPRLPFGLGSLSVEGVALTPNGEQATVMTWAQGADVMTVNARISKDGDAYALAKEFAIDFSKLLVTGTDPMQASLSDLPMLQGISEFFGGKPKHSACDKFGRRNGLGNAVGGVLGLPPSWTDSGGQKL